MVWRIIKKMTLLLFEEPKGQKIKNLELTLLRSENEKK